MDTWYRFTRNIPSWTQYIHHSIKFTFDISNTEAAFLDVTVHKGERFKATQILDCRTHFKTTNTFQYVHGSSCHPPGVKKGIVMHRWMPKIPKEHKQQSRIWGTENKPTNAFTSKRIHNWRNSKENTWNTIGKSSRAPRRCTNNKTEQAMHYLQSMVDRP